MLECPHGCMHDQFCIKFLIIIVACVGPRADHADVTCFDGLIENNLIDLRLLDVDESSDLDRRRECGVIRSLDDDILKPLREAEARYRPNRPHLLHHTEVKPEPAAAKRRTGRKAIDVAVEGVASIIIRISAHSILDCRTGQGERAMQNPSVGPA